jgi:hypothetical protein
MAGEERRLGFCSMLKFSSIPDFYWRIFVPVIGSGRVTEIDERRSFSREVQG